MPYTISVYPEFSPRIIEIIPDDPTLQIQDVTVQEIYNLIRDWEDNQPGMPHDSLVTGAGKEQLGGGVTVGITATLLNAKVMFTAQTTPLSALSTITTGDSNGTSLIDSTADFVTDEIYQGCTVHNMTTGASAVVMSVISATELLTLQLSGGSRATWLAGDSYLVWPNVICNISGGNLVAVDDVGAELTPVLPSPNVQVVRTSSSSATLMELEAIQYSSYNGGVTLDIAGGTAGTAYPQGTPEYPVNNLTDAKVIAGVRGFETIYVIGNWTLQATDDVEGYCIVGQNTSTTEIIFTSGSLVSGEISEATISGTISGEMMISNCIVGDLVYAGGQVKYCVLAGTVVLDGADAYFLNCWSGVAGGLGHPVVDMGGSGRDFNLRQYNGGIGIINLTGSDDKASLDFVSGHAKIYSSVTAGEIVIRGSCKVTDESTGVADVNYDHTLYSVTEVTRTIDWTDVEFVKAIEGGRWKIINNQMIFYDEDNSTEIARFNLFDALGVPAEESVMERQRV
jgi:hypothetical protein